MRPYAVEGRGYRVPASPAPMPRPTRNAAGMSATNVRRARKSGSERGRELHPDALALSVRGTLDVLAATRFDLEPVPCTCCGGKTSKVRLRAGKPRVRLAMIKKSRPRFFLPR